MPYETIDNRADIRRTEHDNGDETHVVVYESGGQWVVLAVDVADGLEGLDSEIVAVTATEQEAEKRADRWEADNPKGLMDGGGGLGGLADRFGGGG